MHLWSVNESLCTRSHTHVQPTLCPLSLTGGGRPAPASLVCVVEGLRCRQHSLALLGLSPALRSPAAPSGRGAGGTGVSGWILGSAWRLSSHFSLTRKPCLWWALAFLPVTRASSVSGVSLVSFHERDSAVSQPSGLTGLCSVGPRGWPPRHPCRPRNAMCSSPGCWRPQRRALQLLRIVHTQSQVPSEAFPGPGVTEQPQSW